jgi:hypothetical protein
MVGVFASRRRGYPAAVSAGLNPSRPAEGRLLACSHALEGSPTSCALESDQCCRGADAALRRAARLYGWAAPFAGVRHPASTAGRVNDLGTKLLGSYEEELATVVRGVRSARLRAIVNIGAFMATPSASHLHCPDAQVCAFKSRVPRGSAASSLPK